MRNNLKQARKAAGMTQQMMAEKLHISIRYYKGIESGEYPGTIPLWDMMEDLFGVHQRALRENHPDIGDSQLKR